MYFETTRADTYVPKNEYADGRLLNFLERETIMDTFIFLLKKKQTFYNLKKYSSTLPGFKNCKLS